ICQDHLLSFIEPLMNEIGSCFEPVEANDVPLAGAQDDVQLRADISGIARHGAELLGLNDGESVNLLPRKIKLQCRRSQERLLPIKSVWQAEGQAARAGAEVIAAGESVPQRADGDGPE